MKAARKGGDSTPQIKTINTHGREIKKAAARINFARERIEVRAALFCDKILRI
jgi:hypothetical protein